MPRLPRIHVEGSIYYVTSKSAQNQTIFRDKADYKMYLELLTKCKKQHPFKLYAFCLRPERLVLFLEPRPGSTISEIMHRLNSFYTKYFNGRYKRHGSLFESRFKSVFVEKSLHLPELTRHVHRLGLSSGEGCTSRGNYIGTPSADAPDMQEEVKEVLDAIGADSAGYAKYMESVSVDEEALLEKRLARGGMLGSDAFVENVKRSVRGAAETRAQAARQQFGPFRRLLAVALVALAVTTMFSVYFYVSRERLKEHYETVVRQMQESLPTESPLAASSTATEAGR